MKRKDIVAALDQIAEILDLKEESPFKVKAYQTAAKALKGFEGDLEGASAESLTEVPGIGKSTAAVILELLGTGRAAVLEQLRSEFSPGLLEMLKVPGLGPKKIRQIVEQLGARSVGELEYACNENRLAALAGFGAKSQDKILKSIAFYKKGRESALYPDALERASEQLERLRSMPEVLRAELAGELRRQCEVAHGIDLIASGPAESLLRRFAEGPGVLEVLELDLGGRQARVRLESGMACKLRVCAPQEFGTAWAKATGSEEHLRQLGELPACEREEDLYERLGKPWIPPALREGLGELELRKAPELIERRHLRGVLHNHTTWSDGAGSLEAMVRQAQKLGFEYILISDHSKAAGYAGGLSEDRVREQHAEIERLQLQFPGIRILKGTEVDILPDGSLDYSDELLASFDLVIASVHSSFHGLSQAEMTARVVRALGNPHVDVLGHPTGRLLLAREGYPLDLDSVLRAAASSGVAIEINAHPQRLDLDWRWMRRAKELGVRFCIDPDAHHLDGLDHVRFGVSVAQKGWLTPDDVWNTRSAQELLDGLAQPRR